VFRSGACNVRALFIFYYHRTFSIAPAVVIVKQSGEQQMKLFPMNIKQTTGVFIIFIDLFYNTALYFKQKRFSLTYKDEKINSKIIPFSI